MMISQGFMALDYSSFVGDYLKPKMPVPIENR